MFRRNSPPPPPPDLDDSEWDVLDEDDADTDAPGRDMASHGSTTAAFVPLRPGENPTERRELAVASLATIRALCVLGWWLALGGTISMIAAIVNTIDSRSWLISACGASVLLLPLGIVPAVIKGWLPSPREMEPFRERTLAVTTSVLSFLAYAIGRYDPTFAAPFFVLGVNGLLIFVLLVFFVARSWVAGRLRTEVLLGAILPLLQCLHVLRSAL